MMQSPTAHLGDPSDLLDLPVCQSTSLRDTSQRDPSRMTTSRRDSSSGPPSGPTLPLWVISRSHTLLYLPFARLMFSQTVSTGNIQDPYASHICILCFFAPPPIPLFFPHLMLVFLSVLYVSALILVIWRDTLCPFFFLSENHSPLSSVSCDKNGTSKDHL